MHITTYFVVLCKINLMSPERNIYNYLSEYLYKTRAKGRYAVTLQELKQSFDVSDKALSQGLFRLKNKKEIGQIRQGFYVIIPPEYSHKGMLPAYLFIDDLMQYLERDYYVGLFSAAALHGAGHQQPMEYQIINGYPTLRMVKNNKIVIHFYPRKKWDKTDIVEKKTDAGYIKVSSPELTMLDLISFHYKIGGFGRILPNLEELTDTIKQSKLLKAARNYDNMACVQRLGFLSENVLGQERLSNSLYGFLKNKKAYQVPLSVGNKGNKVFGLDKKWKLTINIDITAL